MTLKQDEKDERKFEIIKEEVTHKRFLSFIQRKVAFPDGRVIDWDVVGHLPYRSPTFSVIVPFNTKTKTTTLLYEYAQGPNCMGYTFPAGAYEPRKHGSLIESAKAELSEEAALKGGEWIPLLPLDHPGIPELKWGINRFTVFLVLDPEEDPQPGQLDAEECIEIRRNVSMQDIDRLILHGQLMMPSVQATHMALHHLAKVNLLK